MTSGVDLGILAWEHWGQYGVKVFPCSDDKRPLCKWGQDATDDKDDILALFARAGDRAKYIGGAMGEHSGLFALDFDTYKDGGAGKASQFKRVLEASDLLPDTRVHKTVSGGSHYIYFSPVGLPVPRNSVPTDGVEVRGEGGYIILPPSEGYEVVASETVEAPAGLVKRLNAERERFNRSTVTALKRKIIEGENFHEAALLIAAKMSAAGKDPSAIRDDLTKALKASVAADPKHSRHGRWKSIVEGKDGELGRVLGSAYTKYNPKKSADAVDAVAHKMSAPRDKRVGASLFTMTPYPDADDDDPAPASTPAVADDEFPFAKSYNAGAVDGQSDKGYLVYPLIMESDVIVLSAEPKAGKTLMAMTLALHMAAGLPLGDLTPVGPDGKVTPIPVIYFALEGQGAIRKRVKAWITAQQKQGLNLTDEDVHLFVVEQSVNLAKPEDQQEVVDKLVLADAWFKNKGWGPTGMVVIDTLTKAMPGKDQNSVEDTSAVFHTVDMMRESGLECATMFIHHNNRQGKGPRGSSNIMAEPDTILTVSKADAVIIDKVKYDCYGLEVFMARSIDDTQRYTMKAEAVDIGLNQQGIMQVAPVLDIVDDYSVQTTSTEATLKTKRNLAKGEFYGLLYSVMSNSKGMALPISALHRKITSSGNEIAVGYYAQHIHSKDRQSLLNGWDVLLHKDQLPPSLKNMVFSRKDDMVSMQLGSKQSVV